MLSPESFRGLLLRHRGRTGLSQRDLAARVRVSRRTLQPWEVGVNHPRAELLQALIQVLLEAGGLTAGREEAEARKLWAAALDVALRMHTPFDQEWFRRLLAARAVPPLIPAGEVPQAVPAAATEAHPAERGQDWGEAPDILGFVGRTEELATLRAWVLDERSRLVAVLGAGGIGKTSLVAKLANEVAPSFERVYWRGLRNAPPPGEWLAGAIGFLSDQRQVPPAAESEGRATLLRLLRDRRCLLVMDNSETIFEPGQLGGRYRAGLEGYGWLLQAVGEGSHQSCLLLTSREAPPELAALSGGAVRTFHLRGLSVDHAQALLAPKKLKGTSKQWAELNARVGGNGLALKVVGGSIRELFGGELAAFLEETDASSIFGGIRRLLAEQIDRSSVLEQQVLRTLAVEREPVSVAALLAGLGPRLGRGAVLEAVEALRRRSLVERAETPGAAAASPLVGFTLQSVVLQYVTDQLVEVVADEIGSDGPALLVNQPLIKARAKDYVRQTQERLIGVPILQRLNAHYGEDGALRRLLALLDGWRREQLGEQGYGPGNVINLLRLLRGNLRGLDLSHLAILHAYLSEVDAQDASLVDAHLAETTLADLSDFPASVALSSDGALCAVGTATGHVWLWRITDRMPLWWVLGHTGGVWGLALSADDRVLASSGEDGTVRLWDAASGRPLATLEGHTSGVWGVALSADGQLVASGSTDGNVRLWESAGGRLLATLEGHTGGVWGVALSADGQLVASASEDGTVRLWEAAFGRHVATLRGHSGGVRSVALTADGQLLASGSFDGSVRVWEARTGRPAATLQGHTGGVWGVALSADGRLVASGGGDGTVRLWEAATGRLLATLQGHTGGVRGVALSADGQLLASGGFDGSVRLWEAASAVSDAHGADAEQPQDVGGSPATPPNRWRPLANAQGHTGGVWRVALSADGRLLASGGFDGTVKLWEVPSALQLAELRGHTAGVWGVALSADGRLLASGSFDATVRLWLTGSGICLRSMRPDRRYERMDITGLTGITDARRAALLALGAVEQPGGRADQQQLDPSRGTWSC